MIIFIFLQSAEKLMEELKPVLGDIYSKIASLSQERRSPDDKQEKDQERQVGALREQLKAKDDEVKQVSCLSKKTETQDICQM